MAPVIGRQLDRAGPTRLLSAADLGAADDEYLTDDPVQI